MESATRRGLPRAMVDDVFLAPVHINAGGTVYTTTLDTLTKYPESKLAKLFDGSLAISIDPINHQYFLDVNGSVFAHVLDFLRYGELLLPDDFTQLPLLTKLAEFFGIREMVEGLLNMGGEESFGSQEDRTTAVIHKKKKRRNKKSLETTSDNVVGQEEIQMRKKENLEADSVKTDGVVGKSKINIGTCDLGIKNLGTLEGGKVDFGIVETATMKGKRLESEMLAAKTIETSTLAARTIEAKSTKVEVVMAELLKSETVEIEKVKTGNVEMQTIDAGLTKTGTLETKSLSSKTVDMTKVNAEDVKIKTLEAENLKVKTLDVGTLSANILSALSSKSTMTNCNTINANDSNFVMVQASKDKLCLLATDHGLQVEDIGISFRTAWDRDGQYWESTTCCLSGSKASCYFGIYLLRMFTFLSKNGYKLKNASVVQSANSNIGISWHESKILNIREYIFAK